MKFVLCLLTLFFSSFSFATLATITLTNTKAGERATYYVNSGASALLPVGSHTVLANTTGSTALPTAVSYSALNSALGVTALQNGTLTPQTETVSSAGALSTTKAESLITNGGSTFAVTLAAPSSQDGQLKIIKATTPMTGTITLALTNVQMSGAYTPTGTTTLTFTNVGDTAVFIAVGSKWVYLGGSAVAS